MSENDVMEVLRMGTPVVVAVVAFLVAELLKVWPDINKRFIPLVNIGVGITAFAAGVWIGVISAETPIHIFAGLVSCLLYALGAGGFYDLVKTKTEERGEGWRSGVPGASRPTQELGVGGFDEAGGGVLPPMVSMFTEKEAKAEAHPIHELPDDADRRG